MDCVRLLGAAGVPGAGAGVSCALSPPGQIRQTPASTRMWVLDVRGAEAVLECLDRRGR